MSKVPTAMKTILDMSSDDASVETKFEFQEGKLLSWNKPHVPANCRNPDHKDHNPAHYDENHKDYQPGNCVNQWGIRVAIVIDGEEVTRNISLKGYPIVKFVLDSLEEKDGSKLIKVPVSGLNYKKNPSGVYWAPVKDIVPDKDLK